MVAVPFLNNCGGYLNLLVKLVLLGNSTANTINKVSKTNIFLNVIE